MTGSPPLERRSKDRQGVRDRSGRTKALHGRSRREGGPPVGDRSAQSGPYVGYELHLAVPERDVRWTNHIDRTSVGPEG